MTNALRVLIIEDDAIIGILLSEILVGMGYEVCSVETTEAEAVSAAVRCRPDLMIVDVRLENGDGVSAVEKIRRNGFVPHVFISGDPASLRALKPGAVVIQKPFREADLAQAIRRALDSAAALPREELGNF